MSSRPLLRPTPVVTNGDMTTTITSAVTILTNLSMVSYGLSWAGTAPVGNISVQVSNDYAVNAAGAVSNAGTWTTLTLSSPTAVSGNTGTGFVDVTQTAAYAIRLQYVPISGTGTLQATVNCRVQ